MITAFLPQPVTYDLDRRIPPKAALDQNLFQELAAIHAVVTKHVE